MLAVGDDNLYRIDVRRSPSRPLEGGGEDRRRHALAARDEQVARAWREVPEHADRDAQLAVLARGGVDGAPEDGVAPARRDQLAGDLAMTPQERRSRPGGVGCARRGACGALEQQIGDAGERRGDDDERPVMPRDQRAARSMAVASASDAPPNFQTSSGAPGFFDFAATRRPSMATPRQTLLDRAPDRVVVVRQLDRRIGVARCTPASVFV